MHSPSELESVVRYVLPLLDERPIVALTGDLGAGKTTFVSQIAQHLAVIDDVSSPTFSIINTYQRKNGQYIHHIDLYRIEKNEELVQIGLDDYLHSGEIVFIEWPEISEEYLPDHVLRMRFEHIDRQCRKIVIL